MEFTNLLYKQGTTDRSPSTPCCSCWRRWHRTSPPSCGRGATPASTSTSGRGRSPTPSWPGRHRHDGRAGQRQAARPLEVDAGIDEAEAEAAGAGVAEGGRGARRRDAEEGHRPPAQARQHRRVTATPAGRLRPRRHAHRPGQPAAPTGSPTAVGAPRSTAGIPVVAVTGRPWQWTLDLARAHGLLPVRGRVERRRPASTSTTGDGRAHRAGRRHRARADDADPRRGAGHHLRRRRDRPASWPRGRLPRPGLPRRSTHVDDLAAARRARRHQADRPRGRACPAPTWPPCSTTRSSTASPCPTPATGEWVELLASGVSKASGLAVVAERLGVGAGRGRGRRRRVERRPDARRGPAWASPWATPPARRQRGGRPGRPDRRRRRRRRASSTSCCPQTGSVTRPQPVGVRRADARTTPHPGRTHRGIAAGRPGAGTLTFVIGGARGGRALGRASSTTPGPSPPPSRPAASAPGSHVALLGPTTRPLVTAIEAVWLCGATLDRAAAADAARLDRGVRRPDPHAGMASADVVAAPRRSRPGAVHRGAARRPADGARSPTCTAGAGRPTAATSTGPTYDPDALAVLQFTSGSTAEPKGVMLPNRTICANLDGIGAAARLDPDVDVLVSWLPLYHDMGLVGLFMLPASTGARPRARRAAGLPRLARCGGWSGCRTTAAPPPPARTSPRCSPRARCATPRASTCRRCGSRSTAPSPSTPTPSSGSSPPAAEHGMRPRRGLPGLRHGRGDDRRHRSPSRGRGLVTDCVDRRVLETERYAAPVDARRRRRPAAGPARPGRARPRAAHLRPRHRRGARPTARSASCRSGARR